MKKKGKKKIIIIAVLSVIAAAILGYLIYLAIDVVIPLAINLFYAALKSL